ncbi:hypothetical protein [Planctobacterium marinum]|uniref:Uncharacterized protein n=1 Tax=Planctobacterium marinum TaxID=1631968 RepID=A0AA48KP88_9ALTE|nr:hypothetical protein MACH26_19120 [Planctobacterium marinum]
MRSVIKTLMLGLMLGLTSTSYAADNPNLLVLGEDADEDSIPRDSRVFKRVLGALANQMHDESFDVYDETAITLDNFEQGRVRRTDAEVIDVARSIKRPPIDVAVLFTIYASAKDTGYTTKVKARIEGRLLNVQTGKRLGNFEVDSGKTWNAPRNCERECILEVVGDKARVLGNDLGAVLAEKLAWMVDGGSNTSADRAGSNSMVTDYYLVFDNFSAEDFMDIEEYLVIFSGYESHRPTEQRHTRSEVMYRSSITSAKLNRNLKKMLEELDLRGVVTFEGNTFTVKQITLRGKKKKPDASDGW